MSKVSMGTSLYNQPGQVDGNTSNNTGRNSLEGNNVTINDGEKISNVKTAACKSV